MYLSTHLVYCVLLTQNTFYRKKIRNLSIIIFEFQSQYRNLKLHLSPHLVCCLCLRLIKILFISKKYAAYRLFFFVFQSQHHDLELFLSTHLVYCVSLTKILFIFKKIRGLQIILFCVSKSRFNTSYIKPGRPYFQH